jgi:tetratricopeptide (TPR) repeat protein
MKRRAPAAARPRKALWVTTAILLAAVAGAAFFIARARRPAPLALQSEWKPPPVPALDALPWPRVRPEASSSLQAGLGHLSRALAQYGDGRSAEGDAEFREAIATLKAAGAIVPELGPAHLRFVMSAAAARDFPEAERRAEAWLTTFPQDFEHLFLLGQLRYQMRKWSDSAASLRTAARLRPELADVHRWLAQACSQLGAQDDGVAAVKRSLALVGFPDGSYAEQPLARAVLGNAIVVLHHFQEYELLEQVAAAFRKRFGDEGEAIMAQGISLSNLGRYAEAEPLLLRALVDTANSENVDEVAFELGLCLAKQAKWKDAAKVLQELLERDPGYTKAYYQLSLVAVRLGRAAEAAALAAKAEALSASARELRRERELRAAGQTGRAAAAAATGHLLRGDFERAERALRAPELRMEPHAVFALADLYLDELRSAECEQVLEHAVTSRGGGPTRTSSAGGPSCGSSAVKRKRDSLAWPNPPRRMLPARSGSSSKPRRCSRWGGRSWPKRSWCLCVAAARTVKSRTFSAARTSKRAGRTTRSQCCARSRRPTPAGKSGTGQPGSPSRF